MKHRNMTVVFIAASLVPAILMLAGCGTGGGNAGNTLAVYSVAEGSDERAAFSYETTVEEPGWIISGPPDYIKITLNRIDVKGEFSDGSTEAIAWQGSKTMKIDGSTPVDVSGIEPAIPAGTVTGVSLYFDAVGKVKGSVSGLMRVGSPVTEETVTAYTKADYAYDEVAHTGGRADYLDFSEGSAEEMDFYYGNDVDQARIDISFVVPVEVTGGDPVQLSILFDTSRMLRFDNGWKYEGEGSTGSDVNAHFFCQSVFRNSVAAFLGEPGTIQGYETHFCTDDAGGNKIVSGWMTLVFDSDGTFLSGNMIGNDDNALCIAKGLITGMTEAGGGAWDITYHLDDDDNLVNGFRKLSTVGNEIDPIATFTTSLWNGEANFILRLQK